MFIYLILCPFGDSGWTLFLKSKANVTIASEIINPDKNGADYE